MQVVEDAWAVFSWQGGYAAFAVSESNVRGVMRYIAEQPEHHKTHTFKEELLAILQEHGVDYDERYLWD